MQNMKTEDRRKLNEERSEEKMKHETAAENT